MSTQPVSSYINSFQIVGKGVNAGPGGQIVVDGGWGIESALEGAVLLYLSKTLRNVRIQVEYRGYCETRWDAPLRLATKPDDDTYKATRSGRVFQQIVDVVYESSEPLQPNPVGGSLVFPFRLKLPGNGLPPSYETVHGSIQYYIKCTILVQEGMKLLKSSYDLSVPCTVYMPDVAKIKMLQSPSQIIQQEIGNNEKAGYSLSLPRRILNIGEVLEVNLAVVSTPGDARLRSFNVSLRTVASYISGNNTGAHAPTPRPLSEMSQTFPLVKIGGPGGGEPLVHRLFLEIDPEIAQPSIESTLISVKTVLRMEIILDNSETPNQHFELPIVVVPLLKQPPPSPAISASLGPSLHRSKSHLPLQTPPPRHSDDTGSNNSSAPSTAPTFVSTRPRTDSLKSPYSPNRQAAIPTTPHHAPMPEAPLIRNKTVSSSPSVEPRSRHLQPESSAGTFTFLMSGLQGMDLNEDNGVLSVSPTAEESPEEVLPNASWSVEMVGEWLRALGATVDIILAFSHHGIDGKVLLSLTAQDLRGELGVVSFGLRRKILVALEKCR